MINFIYQHQGVLSVLSVIIVMILALVAFAGSDDNSEDYYVHKK